MKLFKFALIVGLFVSSSVFAGADVTTDQLNELNVNYVEVSDKGESTITVLKTESTADVVDTLAVANVVVYAKSFEEAAAAAKIEARRKERQQ